MIIIIKKIDTNSFKKREKKPLYIFKSGATYEGEWFDGMRDGYGTQIWTDGAKYEGNKFNFISFYLIFKNFHFFKTI